MLREKIGCHRGCCWPCFWVVAPSSRLSQSIRSNFLHLSALDSEPGSELQFETHQSNRVPRMFLVSFRVSFLNLAQASCMFLIPLVSFVNLAPSSRLHRCSMNLVWIVNRFSMILESFGGPKFHDFGVVLGSKIDEKSVLGGLLGPRPILEVQKPSETFVLGGQVGAFLGLSRLLAASWSLKKRLEASPGGLEPLFFPSQVPNLSRTSFWIDFGPQNGPKIIKKSIKNPCPQEVGKEGLFRGLLHRKFKMI